MAQNSFKFIGDRQNATFRWEIHCLNDQGSPVTLSGYSKSMKFNEPQNKQVCLFNCVERILVRNGYLERAYNIEFFKNEHKGVNDMLLISATQKFIALYHDARHYFELVGLVEKLNEGIKSGTKIKNIEYPKVHTKIPESVFDFKKGRFKNEEELFLFCEDLKKKYGHEKNGRITGFKNKYMELHFSTPISSSDTLNPEHIAITLGNKFNINPKRNARL